MITSWKDFIKQESYQGYYKNILSFLKEDGEKFKIYPAGQDIFNAFDYSPLDKTKVLILGQDPYHNPGEAHGLSFSVKEGVKTPPSLQNIYKELKSDLGLDIPKTGCLVPWAEQGVLLLNACLTVRKNEPNAHKNIGWHIFTDKVISTLNQKDTPVVFILWGAFARAKKDIITNARHLILESPHPSPFSASSGFFGSKPFSKTNEFLEKNNLPAINWKL